MVSGPGLELAVLIAAISADTSPAGTLMGANSYEPMSHAGPFGRATPRWSVETVQVPGGTASIAGFPIGSGCVDVGPPLFCRGPRFGETFCRSVGSKPEAPATCRTS